MAFTFRGGTHVREYKYTSKSPIEKMTAPDTVYIPLSQHIGAMCTPTVKVGDAVTRGQKIGDVEENALGCPVHSSVSGKVIEIREVPTPTGQKNKYVVIENDHLNTMSPDIVPFRKPIQETIHQVPWEVRLMVCVFGSVVVERGCKLKNRDPPLLYMAK